MNRLNKFYGMTYFNDIEASVKVAKKCLTRVPLIGIGFVINKQCKSQDDFKEL